MIFDGFKLPELIPGTQRMDARCFSPAGSIDPVYAEELKRVNDLGVEIIVRDTIIDTGYIRMGSPVPVDLNWEKK